MNTYSVAILDQADADLERTLNRLVMISVETAVDWQVGFESALSSLTSLPNRCPKARDGGHYPGVVVRQLYYGKYRLLFHVVEADADETEGAVIVLRVLYGSQSMDYNPRDEA